MGIIYYNKQIVILLLCLEDTDFITLIAITVITINGSPRGPDKNALWAGSGPRDLGCPPLS